MFTFTGRISVSREESDVVIFDKGIALAISEEKSTADDPFAGDQKLTEKVDTAYVGLTHLFFTSGGFHDFLILF